jgi:hypothetical protein
MPKISEMTPSKFLKQSDVVNPVLWTVSGCMQQNVAKEGAEPEPKWCLTFYESDKPLVLNSTNIQLCAKVFESEDTDHWVGQRIVLYVDPNVSFGGKVVGGIRVRKPKKTAPPPPARPVLAGYADEDDDSAPF